MRRFEHSYGGIATEVGTFSVAEIARYFELGWSERQALTEAQLNPMKVLDFIVEDREILVYSTRKHNEFRIVCINRDNKQAIVKRNQEIDKMEWLLDNPIPR